VPSPATATTGPFAKACEALRCRAAVIDGEIVVEDERGASDFDKLRSAIGKEPQRLVFHAFDLVWLDDVDLRNEPLIDRRKKLAKLMGSKHAPCLRYRRTL
jgi:bifunctional non-homologous end joining protein LigD